MKYCLFINAYSPNSQLKIKETLLTKMQKILSKNKTLLLLNQNFKKIV